MAVVKKKSGHAMELRAEELQVISPGEIRRKGRLDGVTVGGDGAVDVVEGSERVRVRGNLYETLGSVRQAEMGGFDTEVRGGLSLRGTSNTGLLAGGMSESYHGPQAIVAGMSDDMVAGPACRAATVQVGGTMLLQEEQQLGSSINDLVLMERHALCYEREFAFGRHTARTAVFKGKLHSTLASGFLQLWKIHTGRKNRIRMSSEDAAEPEEPENTDPSAAATAALGAQAAGGTARGANQSDDSGDLARTLNAATSAEDAATGVQQLEETSAVNRADSLLAAQNASAAEDTSAAEDAAQADALMDSMRQQVGGEAIPENPDVENNYALAGPESARAEGDVPTPPAPDADIYNHPDADVYDGPSDIRTASFEQNAPVQDSGLPLADDGPVWHNDEFRIYETPPSMEVREDPIYDEINQAMVGSVPGEVDPKTGHFNDAPAPLPSRRTTDQPVVTSTNASADELQIASERQYASADEVEAAEVRIANEGQYESADNYLETSAADQPTLAPTDNAPTVGTNEQIYLPRDQALGIEPDNASLTYGSDDYAAVDPDWIAQKRSDPVGARARHDALPMPVPDVPDFREGFSDVLVDDSPVAAVEDIAPTWNSPPDVRAPEIQELDTAPATGLSGPAPSDRPPTANQYADPDNVVPIRSNASHYDSADNVVPARSTASPSGSSGSQYEFTDLDNFAGGTTTAPPEVPAPRSGRSSPDRSWTNPPPSMPAPAPPEVEYDDEFTSLFGDGPSRYLSPTSSNKGGDLYGDTSFASIQRNTDLWTADPSQSTDAAYQNWDASKLTYATPDPSVGDTVLPQSYLDDVAANHTGAQGQVSRKRDFLSMETFSMPPVPEDDAVVKADAVQFSSLKDGDSKFSLAISDSSGPGNSWLGEFDINDFEVIDADTLKLKDEALQASGPYNRNKDFLEGFDGELYVKRNVSDYDESLEELSSIVKAKSQPSVGMGPFDDVPPPVGPRDPDMPGGGMFQESSYRYQIEPLYQDGVYQASEDALGGIANGYFEDLGSKGTFEGLGFQPFEGLLDVKDVDVGLYVDDAGLAADDLAHAPLDDLPVTGAAKSDGLDDGPIYAEVNMTGTAKSDGPRVDDPVYANVNNDPVYANVNNGSNDPVYAELDLAHDTGFYKRSRMDEGGNRMLGLSDRELPLTEINSDTTLLFEDIGKNEPGSVWGKQRAEYERKLGPYKTKQDWLAAGNQRIMAEENAMAPLDDFMEVSQRQEQMAYTEYGYKGRWQPNGDNTSNYILEDGTDTGVSVVTWDPRFPEDTKGAMVPRVNLEVPKGRGVGPQVAFDTPLQQARMAAAQEAGDLATNATVPTRVVSASDEVFNVDPAAIEDALEYQTSKEALDAMWTKLGELEANFEASGSAADLDELLDFEIQLDDVYGVVHNFNTPDDVAVPVDDVEVGKAQRRYARGSDGKRYVMENPLNLRQPEGHAPNSADGKTTKERLVFDPNFTPQVFADPNYTEAEFAKANPDLMAAARRDGLIRQGSVGEEGEGLWAYYIGTPEYRDLSRDQMHVVTGDADYWGNTPLERGLTVGQPSKTILLGDDGGAPIVETVKANPKFEYRITDSSTGLTGEAESYLTSGPAEHAGMHTGGPIDVPADWDADAWGSWETLPPTTAQDTTPPRQKRNWWRRFW